MSELNDINAKQIMDEMKKELVIVIKKSEERDKKLKSMSGVEIQHELKNMVNEIKSGLMKEGIPLGHLDHILDKSGFSTACIENPIFILSANVKMWVTQLVNWNSMEFTPIEKQSITIEINR